MAKAKNYGLGKDTFKAKHYKPKKYKGPKIGSRFGSVKRSFLKAGKKNKLGVG